MSPRLPAILAILVLLLAPLSTQADIVYLRSFDGGPEEDFLSAPAGLSIGFDGLLWAADASGNRVVAFDSTGAVRMRIGFAGSGEGRFLEPTDVAAGEGLHLYVLDAGNERIQVFDRYGQFSETILSREEGTIGLPTGIEADPFGRLYVADAEEDRVRIFRSYTGEEEFALGGFGSEPGRFRRPMDIAVDRGRRIYVADRENGRIQVFDSLGAFLYSLGDAEGPGRLSGPEAVAVDRLGFVFVADPAADRVVVFRPGGAFEEEIRTLPDGSRLASPRGVAAGEGGILYVSDTENGRIHLFRCAFPNRAR